MLNKFKPKSEFSNNILAQMIETITAQVMPIITSLLLISILFILLD